MSWTGGIAPPARPWGRSGPQATFASAARWRDRRGCRDQARRNVAPPIAPFLKDDPLRAAGLPHVGSDRGHHVVRQGHQGRSVSKSGGTITVAGKYGPFRLLPFSAGSVNRYFRQRRPGQFEKQLAKVVDGPVRAPSADSPIVVLAAPLDQPLRAVEPKTPLLRVERPERCGDQRIVRASPTHRRQQNTRAPPPPRRVPAIDRGRRIWAPRAP